MKILIIGFLVFFCWSIFSTYSYVCKIKGLCIECQSGQIGEVNQKEIKDIHNWYQSVVIKQSEIPKNLTVYFEFDKSEFNSDAKTEKYLDASKIYLNQNILANLTITGYTDAVGSNEYNIGLGYRRAQVLQHYFENKGLLTKKIIIESKGEQEPVGDNNTTEGRKNNRRTVITIKK